MRLYLREVDYNLVVRVHEASSRGRKDRREREKERVLWFVEGRDAI